MANPSTVVSFDGTDGTVFELTNAGFVTSFGPGTHILTDRGEIAVETLAIGDTVITASGDPAPVRWIGHRHYAGRFLAGNPLMLPVTINPGALADGIPTRPLHLSPGHGIFVDGQLVPALRLVNGSSITQARAVDQVSYYHVELDRHALLLAEGAPAESFLDADCRSQFHNAAEFTALYPDAPPMTPLHPRLEDGFALQMIQERLATRAGVTAPVEPAGRLHGVVDLATPDRIAGWAIDADNPDQPVALEITADGRPVLCVLANAYRADLRQAWIGSGCHAFDLALRTRGPILVRRVTDGSVLPPAIVLDARRAA